MEGVSTRRVDDLIKALGCDGISRNQVSRICEQLDEVVESFLGRPLGRWPLPLRMAGLPEVVDRGLSGVELVTSDAHQGLKTPSARCSLGPAGSAAAPTSWPTCSPECPSVPNLAWLPKTFSHGTHHLPATVSRRGPRPTRPSGGTTPGAVSPGGGAAGGRRAGPPGLHGLPSGPLAEAVVQQPAGTAEPGDPSPQSLPPKGDVVGIFPNRLSARRLVGAVLAEQHDEWAEARRYLTIPNAASNEALPEPNMLDAAARANAF